MAEPGLSARYAREVSEKASTCSSLRTAAASAVGTSVARPKSRKGTPRDCHAAVSVVRMRFRYIVDVCCKCLLQISVAHVEKQTHRMQTRHCTMSHLSGGSSYLRVVRRDKASRPTRDT